MDTVRGIPAIHGGREAGPPTRRHHARMDRRDQGHRAIVARGDHGAGAGPGASDGAPRAVPGTTGRSHSSRSARTGPGSPSSSTSSRRIRSRRPGTPWASSSVRWRETCGDSRSSSSRAGRRPVDGVVRSRPARRWAPAAEPRRPCKGRQAEGTDDRDVLGPTLLMWLLYHWGSGSHISTATRTTGMDPPAIGRSPGTHRALFAWYSSPRVAVRGRGRPW